MRMKAQGIENKDGLIEKEIKIFEKTQDAEVDDETYRQQRFRRRFLPSPQFDHPDEIRPCRGERNQDEKTPIPPSVEQITGRNHDEILKFQTFFRHPICRKNAWEKPDKLTGIE